MHFFFSNRIRIIEEFFHQVIIVFSNCFYQVCSPFVCFFNHVSRNRNFFKGHTFSFHIPYNTLHGNQIYHTFKIVFSTDRQLQRHRLSTQHFLYLIYHHQEIGTRTVHFVYETDTRNFVTVCLTPYSFRLRFNTINRTEQGNQTIQYTHRTFYLDGKIHVTWSIDNIKVVIFSICIGNTLNCREFPLATNCRRSNSDTSFFFLFHPVGSSSTIVYFTDFMNHTCVA